MSVRNRRLIIQRQELQRKRRIKTAAAIVGIAVCLCIYMHYEMAFKFIEATSAIYGICELLME